VESNVYDISQVPNNCSITLSRSCQILPYVGATPGYFISIIILICCTIGERSFFKCWRTHPAIKLDVSCECLRSPGGLLQLWEFLFVMILHVVDPSSGLAYNLQKITLFFAFHNKSCFATFLYPTLNVFPNTPIRNYPI
jgi:hypothetical protein